MLLMVTNLPACWFACSLRESGFPIHLLPEVGDPGVVAGRMSRGWHGIPKGAEVGLALGDFQCSVYSCLAERSDAGSFLQLDRHN